MTTPERRSAPNQASTRSAVGMVARVAIRRRWLGLVGVAVLIGALGSVSLAAFAGARRSADVVERFRTETRASDVLVNALDPEQAPAAIDAVAALPETAALGRGTVVFTGALQDADLFVISPDDNALFTEVDRPLLLDGRLPAEGRSDEVALNERAAELLGVGVGDRFVAPTISPETFTAAQTGAVAFAFDGPPLDLEVVGLTRLAWDLRGVSTDAGGIMAPGLGRRLDGRAWSQPVAQVRLRGGDHDVAAVQDAIRTSGGTDVVTEDIGKGLDGRRDAMRVMASALGVFGVVAALAGAVAVGEVLSRQAAATAEDRRVLGALGLSRVDRARAGVWSLAPGLIAGAVLATAGAYALSGLFPMGAGRPAEPNPGLRVDGPVLFGGGLAVFGLALAWSGTVFWREARRGTRTEAERPSSLAGFLARADAPVATVTGARLALERGRGRSAVPVRSAVTGVVVGVAGVVAASVFVMASTRVVDTPARWGWDWTFAPDLSQTPDADVVAALENDPDITEASVFQTFSSRLDGREVRSSTVEPLVGARRPVVLDGRLPVAADEVALASTTMRDLGVGIGDTVTADRPARAPDDGQVAPSDPPTDSVTTLTVVGRVVAPPISGVANDDGAVVADPGLALSEGFLVKYTKLVVATRPGADLDAVQARLENLTMTTDGVEGPVLDFGPDARAVQPPKVYGLGGVLSVPRVLVGFFALIGIVGLVHVLVMSVRRRRRDLAVLRALGCRPGQVTAALVWQSLVITVIGLAIGLPVGLLAGRLLWTRVAADLGVADDLLVPPLVVVTVCLGALAVAVLAAWPSGHWVGGRRPADALRAE